MDELNGVEPEAVEPEEVQEVEESATPEIEEASQEEAEADRGDPNGEGFQKRVNKITREKHEQRERAERAEQELEQLRQNQSQQQPVGNFPQLDDPEIDYDEGKHRAAIEAYQQNLVSTQVAKTIAADRQQRAQDEQSRTYNQKVADLKVDDFAEVTSQLPRALLKNGAVDAIVESGAADVAYFLGQHLDVADEIAYMSPVQAAVKIGQISAQLASGSKQRKKQTTAPDPVTPLKAGGKVSKSYDSMSMEEIMNTP